MNKERLKKILIMVIACIILITFLFPYVVMLITSLKSKSEIYSIPPKLLPQEWMFSNFIDVWTAIPLKEYILNSIIISVSATLLALLCALPAAYALARLKFFGKNLFIYIIVVTQMFAPIILLVGLVKEIQWFGLMDSLAGLILINTAFNQAFAVWILYGYLNTIPYELEQAAWIDGSTRLQAFIKIILPNAAPGIVTAALFTFISTWNEFVVALTLIRTDTTKPITVGIHAFFGKYDVEWQYLFATSLIATIPVLIMFLSIEKYLVSGLTAGSVKD